MDSVAAYRAAEAQRRKQSRAKQAPEKRDAARKANRERMAAKRWQQTPAKREAANAAAAEAAYVRKALKWEGPSPDQQEARRQQLQDEYRSSRAPAAADSSTCLNLWGLRACQLAVRANNLQAKAARDSSWQEDAAYVADQAAAAMAKLPPPINKQLHSCLEERAARAAVREERLRQAREQHDAEVQQAQQAKRAKPWRQQEQQGGQEKEQQQQSIEEEKQQNLRQALAFI